MCLWQALKLWKKQLEVRSLIWFGGVTFEVRRSTFSGNVSKCDTNSYAKFPAWKGLNSQPKSTRSTTEERRHRRGANDCGRAAAHPRPPPPKPSLIPFLSWHSIACRCCYGVDVRLPGHREHIRRDILKPVTYRSGRVTLVYLNARSSESWRVTTNFIFLFDW